MRFRAVYERSGGKDVEVRYAPRQKRSSRR
jgi:hypothetical protein